MRTVDATLTAALAAGTGKPYFKAYVGYDNGTVKNSHTDLWAYRLTGQTLEFWIPSITNLASDQEQIWLERGLTIAGTNYTLTTGRFWIWEEEYLPNKVTRYKGGIVPRSYHSDSLTSDDYEAVIDAFFAAFGKTTTYKDASEAWLAYQFMPNPTELVLTDAERMLPLLSQKRLIGCCDNGAEDIRVFSTDVLGSAVATITVSDEFYLRTTKQRARQYLWRDELGATHQDGDATDPVHNLGFMMSTDGPPARNNQSAEFSAYILPDLRLQDGDTVRALMYGGTASSTFFAKVSEEYTKQGAPYLPSPGHLPAWRLRLEAWPIFGNTEGGDLPANVANRVNNAYINPSNFDAVLSQNETNIQAALDVLDDHHPGGFVRRVLGADMTKYVRANLGTCTISNASPAVVTINGHGLSNGDPVAFFTTGALPTGLTDGTVYYVVNKASNTFEVSATVGGASINTSSAGSGTHSVATGSDSNDGTAADRAHALLTIQAAVDAFQQIDLAGYTGTIQCAKSKYLGQVYLEAPFVGGVVTLVGDATTPTNVWVYSSTNVIWLDAPAVRLKVSGLKLESTGGSLLLAQNGGVIEMVGKMHFAACGYVQLYVATGGQIKATSISYDVSGGGSHHARSEEDSTIKVSGGTVTFLANVTYSSTTATASRASLLEMWGQTWSLGIFAVTGTRYAVAGNSVIFTNGGGANYFPGTVAGSTSTGGQYI